MVTSVSPDINTGQNSLWFDVIKVDFDQDIDPLSVPGNITVTGSKSGNISFTTELPDAQEIILTPDSWYTALETVSVELNTGIVNKWGTPLDGNKNGDPDPPQEDNVRFQFRTGMLADYDGSNSIDLADFNTLKNAWTGTPKDYSMELGPVTGELPYLKIQPDNTFDLSDLMVLVSMWNWSFDNSPGDFLNFGLAKPISNADAPVVLISNYERNGVWNATKLDGLALDLTLRRDHKIKSVEYFIKYNPTVIKYQETSISAIPEEDRQNWIILSRNNSEKGIVGITIYPMFDTQWNLCDFSRLGSIKFEALTDCETEVNCQLTTMVVDEDSVMLDKSTSYYTFETKPEIPRRFALHQNFPNPFNPLTRIRYELPKECDVKLAVFNIRGELIAWVVDSHQQPGYYEMQWDGRNKAGQAVSSGIYLYRIQAGSYIKTQKMVLMK